jgi:adenylyltransferase/sulfurtransferase
MSTADSGRYRRQVALPQIGTAGQRRLEQGSALIVGIGGLGCPAALYLANSGVGRIVLNDFDRVEATNLPRQILFTAADLGENKALAGARRLAAFNPRTVLETITTRLDAAAMAMAVSSVDLVLDASDNFATRWLVNRACHAACKPLVSGAAIRFEGQVAVFRHDRPGGPCYRCLYGEEDENLEDCTGQGILAPVAGAIGALMAVEAVKLLAGIDTALAGHLWIHDLLSATSRTLAIPRRADCPVCAHS